MRFIEHLAQRGDVSSARAREVLEGKNQDPAWFGTLAYLLGFLGRQDIDRVLRQQRSTGLRFGEQALRMGLLDERQSNEVLELQRDRSVLFTEVAAALEALTGPEASARLREYLER